MLGIKVVIWREKSGRGGAGEGGKEEGGRRRGGNVLLRSVGRQLQGIWREIC